jgi:hypothetical protein
MATNYPIKERSPRIRRPLVSNSYLSAEIDIGSTVSDA